MTYEELQQKLEELEAEKAKEEEEEKRREEHHHDANYDTPIDAFHGFEHDV